jgi:tRNA (mo5U34)-methyltransferase
MNRLVNAVLPKVEAGGMLPGILARTIEFSPMPALAASDTEQRSLQQQIDEVDWYHEFDFGNGLRAVSKTEDVRSHRYIWAHIRAQLDKIDFRGKTVLDIGCWDGYWSFYAEKRGAKSVLATDDMTQNWADGRGLLLAKRLLNSSIDVDQAVSIYELSRLNRTFDIILCLGVYYHLVDPFAGFAQIRHCCHPKSLVVLEGDATLGLREDTVYYHPRRTGAPVFIPTLYTLTQMLKAAYLDVIDHQWREIPRAPSLLRRLEYYSLVISRPAYTGLPRKTDRLITTCLPFEGENATHHYRPPFGLERYDDRFR